MIYVWHDADNNGGWRDKDDTPQWEELRVFNKPDTPNSPTWNYFFDMCQEDFSFTGVSDLG